VLPVPLNLGTPCTAPAPSDDDGIGIGIATASTLPEGGITTGVCGRAPGTVAGKGIAIGTGPDEGLGAKLTPAVIVWPGGGIAAA
jgi:hypothetical protein